MAATEFGPSYRRATLMQASLAALGVAAALVAWIQGRGLLALMGGLLLGAVIPFTLMVIFPTNKRLLDPGLDRRSAEVAALLDRWGLALRCPQCGEWARVRLASLACRRAGLRQRDKSR